MTGIIKRALTVNDFCEAYSVGRNTAYLEMAAGRLQSVKVGRKRLIPTDAAEAWLKSRCIPETNLAA